MSNTRILPNSEWKEHKSVFSSHSEIPYRVLTMLKEWFLSRINRKKNAKKELAERERLMDNFNAHIRLQYNCLAKHHGYFHSIDEMPKIGMNIGDLAMTKHENHRYANYAFNGEEWQFINYNFLIKTIN